MASFTGNGGYDQDGVYASVTERCPEAIVVVPPRTSAMPNDTAEVALRWPFTGYAARTFLASAAYAARALPARRDRHLQHIAEHDRMAWQKSPGYTTRARAEPAIGRLKQVIGRLRSHDDNRRTTEVDVAAQMLNRVMELGHPNYIRAA